jgi:hypothetical protein
MRLPNELSRDELLELVTSIQDTLFRRGREMAGLCIGYFDADKPPTVDMLRQIAQALSTHELAPAQGAKSPAWPTATLYCCGRCSFAWDEATVRRLTGYDQVEWLANAGELGFCPRCGARCWPVTARTLTDDTGAAESQEGSSQ